MAKRKSHLGYTRNDDDLEKTFPASIAALVAVLRQHWGSISGNLPDGTVQSTDDFRFTPPEDFLSATRKVDEKLKGLRLNTQAEPSWSILKLERGGPEKLHYWHLRLISDWVGLSVGQLLFLTHAISVERRAENAQKDRVAALEALRDEYLRVIGVLDSKIDEARETGEPALYKVVPGEKHEYHPREDVILDFVRAAARSR